MSSPAIGSCVARSNLGSSNGSNSMYSCPESLIHTDPVRIPRRVHAYTAHQSWGEEVPSYKERDQGQNQPCDPIARVRPIPCLARRHEKLLDLNKQVQGLGDSIVPLLQCRSSGWQTVSYVPSNEFRRSQSSP